MWALYLMLTEETLLSRGKRILCRGGLMAKVLTTPQVSLRIRLKCGLVVPR